MSNILSRQVFLESRAWIGELYILVNQLHDYTEVLILPSTLKVAPMIHLGQVSSFREGAPPMDIMLDRHALSFFTWKNAALEMQGVRKKC